MSADIGNEEVKAEVSRWKLALEFCGDPNRTDETVSKDPYLSPEWVLENELKPRFVNPLTTAVPMRLHLS